MKIVMHTMEPRLKALRGTEGRAFFELFVTDPPLGRLFGGGGNYRKWMIVNKNLISLLNSIIFMGNHLIEEEVFLWRKELSPFNQSMRDRYKRVPGIIQDLHIIEGF